MIPVAAIYRLSSKKQVKRQAGEVKRLDGDNLDIPAQRQVVADFIAAHPDWQLVKEYAQAVSAFKVSANDRDEIQDAFRDAATGLWSVLVVVKADRLSRRSLEYPQVLATFHGLGVEVWSVADSPGGKRLTIKSQTDKLVRFMEGWQAESESENSGTRITYRMNQLAEGGQWTGGRVPFGYSLEPLTGADGRVMVRGDRVVRRITPNEWAPVVRELFQRYVAGEGPLKLAMWLNRIGAPTYAGVAWSRQTVAKLLDSAVYAGYIHYNRKPNPDKPAPAPLILAKGQHQAIIDQELWGQAQGIRRLRATTPMRERKFIYPLSGILRCGFCGGPVVGTIRNIPIKGLGKVTYPVYKCSRMHTTNTCRMSVIKASIVEENFLVALEADLTLPTMMRKFLEDQDTAAQEQQRGRLETRKRAQDQLAQLEPAFDRLDEAFLVHGLYTPEEYRQKKLDLQERKGALLADASQGAPAAAPGKDFALLARLVLSLRLRWPKMEPHERKVVAAQLVTQYGVRPVLQKGGGVVLELVN